MPLGNVKERLNFSKPLSGDWIQVIIANQFHVRNLGTRNIILLLLIFIIMKVPECFLGVTLAGAGSWVWSSPAAEGKMHVKPCCKAKLEGRNKQLRSQRSSLSSTDGNGQVCSFKF